MTAADGTIYLYFENKDDLIHAVDFWAVDFSKTLSFPYDQYKVEAECRSVGDYAYCFVESEELIVVGSAALDAFISAFEIAAASSPRDSEKGIYEHVTEVFGDVPDVDDDDRIIILLTLYRCDMRWSKSPASIHPPHASETSVSGRILACIRLNTPVCPPPAWLGGLKNSSGSHLLITVSSSGCMFLGRW